MAGTAFSRSKASALIDGKVVAVTTQSAAVLAASAAMASMAAF